MRIPLALAEIAAGWPLAACLAAVTAGSLRAGRRRAALNEALHELRRPLQALALGEPGGKAGREREGSLEMVTAALERLDREINGGAEERAAEALRARPLLEAAVARWRSRAALGGGSVRLSWEASDPLLRGDRGALARALDNLILNAIEHGGPRIVVEVGLLGGRLRVAVCDSGRASRPASRRGARAELIARLTGRRRHGHGLRVVRRIAAAHRGGFTLRCSGSGSAAVLELPLLDPAEAA